MSVKLFDDALYSAGSRIAEGDYALEFLACMHAGENKATGQPYGPPRLGVMVTFYPINDVGELTGEPIQKHYGMGSKAHESFAPDPDSGKNIVAVPGGKFTTLMGSTNWSVLRKSLVDCDPVVAMLESLADLDGVHVHVMNVPEPEERKDFTAKTGEAVAEQRKGPSTIPVVSEIKEGGKPWEGGGGIPTEEAAPAVAKAPVKAAVAKPGVKPVAKPPVAAAKPGLKKAAPVVEENADEDINALSVSLISAQLEKNLTGMKRLKLRTEVFKAAGENGNAVMQTAFKDDDTLNGFLNSLGYKVEGAEVVAQ